MSDPALIALMGETGSGKSTFVNRATYSEAFVVGDGLCSCTSEIQVSPRFFVDGHPVVLIDTPGFNETVMDDADVLRNISAFLAETYERDVKLAGVIYFHRISETRWRSSDTRSFGWLRRICGETTLRNVVLTTNMWGDVTPEIGAARERQLTAEFVKPALERGAQLHRHYDTTESAHQIIREILNNHRTQTPLQVQRELVDEGREFDRTTVGEEINREVNERAKKLEELRSELRKVRHRGKDTRQQLNIQDAPALNRYTIRNALPPPHDFENHSPTESDPFLEHPKDPPALIAVMGITGSGKTTFVNQASGSSLKVGKTLNSCTSEIQETAEFVLNGRRVVLIDTPGFDDTHRSDMDVLKSIAAFLAESYSASAKLAGVVYVHRISDDRFGGLATKNFRMFRKLCGEKTLKNVVIMTNMWGRVTPQQGADREQQLKDDYFKAAIEKGAQLCRHTDTPESTRAVLRMILGNQPAVLGIQHELIDEHKDIGQTEAGEELKRDICMAVLKYGEDIRELEEDMKRAEEEGDEESREELEEEKRRLQKEMEERQKLMEEMKSTFEEAQREMKERFEERLRRMQEEFKERLRQIQEEHKAEFQRYKKENEGWRCIVM